MELWQRLLSYHRRTTSAFDDELRRTHGVSIDEYDVLYQLSRRPDGMRATALAEALLIAPSSCTRVVATLTERGWVSKRALPEDGRVKIVALTPAGRGLFRRAAAVHLRDIDRRFTGRLRATDLAALDEILRRLGA